MKDRGGGNRRGRICPHELKHGTPRKRPSRRCASTTVRCGRPYAIGERSPWELPWRRGTKELSAALSRKAGLKVKFGSKREVCKVFPTKATKKRKNAC